MKHPHRLGLVLAFAAFSSSANMLEDLYQQALDYDAQYQSSRAEYQANLQSKAALRAAILPQLTASGTAQRQRDEITASVIPQQVGESYSTSYAASLRLTQPIFNWAAFAQYKQIGDRLGQAETGLAAADQELILRVASAYFDWLAAEDSLRFAKAEKEAIGQQLQQAKSRYEVGLSAITDVQEAQARFDASRAQEIVAASALRSAREALQVITGTRPETPQALRTPLAVEPPEPANPDAWVDQAMQNNLNLKQFEFSSRIAYQQIRENQSSQLPQLNLFAEHQINDQSDTPQGLESEGSVVGLQLEIPLFRGGGALAAVRESRFRYEQSEADLLRARRETVQLARDAYDGVVTGEVQVSALRQAVKSAETALEAIEAGFKVGSRTSVDVLNAQRELFGAQRDLSRARYDYLLSVLRLKQAVGALAYADLQQVDAMLIN